MTIDRPGAGITTAPQAARPGFSNAANVCLFLACVLGILLLVTHHSTQRGNAPAIALRNGEAFLVALPLAFWCSLMRPMRGPSEKNAGDAIKSFICAGLGVAAFVSAEGRIQIPGYDGSVYTELAYRQFQGHRPYADFFCPFPPLHTWGAWASFHWLPPRWSSIADAAAVTASITFLWSCLLLRSCGFATWAAILLSLQSQASTSMFVCLWEYSKFGSLFASMLVISTLACISSPRAFGSWVSLSVSMALVSLCKPNLMVLVALTASLAVLVDWRRAACALSCAAALAVLFCVVNRYDVASISETYRLVAASRVRIDLAMLEQKMPEAFLVPLLLTPAALAIAVNEARGEPSVLTKTAVQRCLLLVACLAGSVCQFITNVEFPFVDYTVAAVAVSAVGLSYTGSHRQHDRNGLAVLCRRAALAVCLFWIVFGVKAGAERMFVWASMPGAFFDRIASTTPPARPFFSQCTISPVLSQLEVDVQRVLKEFPKARVFFGPRIEFCYAAFQLASPRNLPIWWHPGSSFPAGEENRVAQSWREHEFEVLVFLKNDFTRVPQEILMQMGRPENYVFSNDLPTLTVAVRRSLLEKRQKAAVK